MSAHTRFPARRLRPKVKGCALAGVLLWFFCIFASASAFAQNLSKQQATAAYLYNFAKNIRWPNEQALSSFEIGLYRVDDPQLLETLDQLAANATLKNLPIHVNRVNTVAGLNKYQLVFVGQISDQGVSDIYSVIDGQPVLLVTDAYANKQWVMINLLSTEDNRLRFEVNKSNLLNQGLQPLPELILVGGSEIDVAKLYREGQASLASLQKKLQQREQAFKQLAANIAVQEARNSALETQLAELNASIANSRAVVARQNAQITEQRAQIDTGERERAALLLDMERRNDDLQMQRQELLKQQEKLEEVRREIDLRERRLAELNSKITGQEAQIDAQRKAIVELDELVGAQKKALRYAWALVVVGMLLIATVFAAYTLKRRANQRLAARGLDLQMARDRLAIAKRKAEDANQAKSEFLSLMSHELRTPLQAIIGYTDVVIEELKLEGYQNYVDDLNRVINNSERLLRLINGVLDLAKIESGRMEVQLSEVKLSTLVDEAVNSVRPQMEKNANQLRVVVDDGDSLPQADPEKLLHILINLLGNANKFTDQGVIELEVRHQPQRIFVKVADNGIGMSQEQQAQIFDRFQQVDRGAARKYQGSGLGLSITRKFCELMGGTIAVESELGEGSTFVVDLPLPIRVPEQPRVNSDSDEEIDADCYAVVAEAPIDVEGAHVVMIDDDRAFLDIMARALTSEGYIVHTADTADEGLRLAQKVKPQVITLDLLLPDQHGWMLFDRIKADPQLRAVPVIVVSITGTTTADHNRRADAYLTKPVGRDALKATIKRVAPLRSP